MGNKYNDHRSILLRPKVCKEPPPPPKEVSCQITPNAKGGERFDSINFEAKGLNTGLPVADFPDVILSVGGNLEFFPSRIPNDGAFHTVNVLLSAVPGVYEGTVVFGWIDEASCVEPMVITIT